MPKVSVNILTKNRAALLEAALLSVAAQTYKDLEIVVVNDGSEDGTENILEKWKSKFQKFKIINHKSSLGITAGRQEALEASGGEYVALLDDDDEWLNPEKLKQQVKFLDSHPDYALVGGGMESVNEKTKTKSQKLRPETDRGIRSTILLRNNFFTSTVMFRRRFALEAGGFVKSGADLAEDYDLWLRMLENSKGANFPALFVRYRQPDYNKEKKRVFLLKQLDLARAHKSRYPGFIFSWLILKARLLAIDLI